MRKFACFAIWLLAACGNSSVELAEEEIPEVYPIPMTYEELKAKLGNIGWQMNPGEYDETYMKLGTASFDRANDLMPWAHVAAATSPICDQVDAIDVSEYSRPNTLYWFADCINGARVIINEDEANSAKAQWPKALIGVKVGSE